MWARRRCTDPKTISLPMAFAAGAQIASLADTLMPEAYEHGGPAVAISTAAGFVLSFVLSIGRPLAMSAGQYVTSPSLTDNDVTQTSILAQ